MKQAIKLLKQRIGANQKTLIQEKKCKSMSLTNKSRMTARKLYIKDLKQALRVLELELERSELLEKSRQPQGMRLDPNFIAANAPSVLKSVFRPAPPQPSGPIKHER